MLYLSLIHIYFRGGYFLYYCRSEWCRKNNTLIVVSRLRHSGKRDCPLQWRGPVSYTHLDVYKRQHQKTVIALWVVLIASVSFGVYKNFTAIDQHTTHEKEIIELCLQDTNGIENFVKNFAKSYYTWNNSKEAIEARTQAISGYLTKELQDLNVDTIRTDIPTSSTLSLIHI